MEQKITFTDSKGLKLIGILSVPEVKNPPIVILCHGFTSSKNGRKYSLFQKLLNDAGIASFRFDFFGHGESNGDLAEITVSEAVDDILNAVKLLRKRGFDEIGLLGSSFGGLASLLAASKISDLFALVTISPVSDWPEMVGLRYTPRDIEKWKEDGFMIYKEFFNTSTEKSFKLNYTIYDNTKGNIAYDIAKQIKAPTLIIHGEKDQIVPISQSRKLAKLIPACQLEEIAGSDHWYTKDEYFNHMIKLASGFLIEKAKELV